MPLRPSEQPRESAGGLSSAQTSRRSRTINVAGKTPLPAFTQSFKTNLQCSPALETTSSRPQRGFLVLPVGRQQCPDYITTRCHRSGRPRRRRPCVFGAQCYRNSAAGHSSAGHPSRGRFPHYRGTSRSGHSAFWRAGGNRPAPDDIPSYRIAGPQNGCCHGPTAPMAASGVIYYRAPVSGLYAGQSASLGLAIGGFWYDVGGNGHSASARNAASPRSTGYL